ncbi:MAG: glycosyltransferase [Candidatus Korarchaeota archaeon]
MIDYDLSIIIPTARCSSILVKVLRYLRKALADENIEIIIATTTDNPCNKIYESICKIVKNCKLLILEKKSLKDSRSSQSNIAVNTSRGKYIYKIDDDIVPTVKLLKVVLELSRRESYDAILHLMVPSPVSIWARARMIEKMYSSFDLYQSSCRIMKRELFVKLGGYREDLVLGEDIEFQHRLLGVRPKIYMVPPLSGGFEIHLGEYKTLKEYVRRAWYYGEYADSLVRRTNPFIVYKAYVKPPTALVGSLGTLIFVWLIYKYVTLASTMLRALLSQISRFYASIRYPGGK